MRYKIIVKPKDKTASGWMIEYFRWESYEAPAPDIHLIEDWSEDDGVFTSEIECGPGTWGLAGNLALKGREIEIDLTPRPKIKQPAGKTWPFTMKVPQTQTHALKIVYFTVADQ